MTRGRSVLARLLANNLTAQLRSSFWALGDQAVVSLATFAGMILVARTLPQDDYGIFTLLYSLSLFLTGITGSVIVYPMTLSVAASADPVRGRQHFLHSLLLCCALLVPYGLLAAGILAFLDELSLWPAFLAYVTFWQLQEVARRCFMAQLSHGRALVGDTIAYGGQAIVLWLIAHSDVNSLPVVFLAMAGTAALALVTQIVQLRRSLRSLTSPLNTAIQFWTAGRWVFYNSLLYLLGNQIFPWVIVYFHGLAAAASLRAAFNLGAACHPVLFGLGSVVVPAVAHRVAGSGRTEVRALTGRFLGLGGVILLPYLALLLAFPQIGLRLFYGANSPYLGLTTEVQLVALCYVLIVSAGVLELVLRGLAETKPVFRNQCFSLASVVLGGIALTYVFGVEGAILGSGVSSLVILVAHGTSLLEATKAGRHETSSLATDRQPYLASSLRKAG